MNKLPLEKRVQILNLLMEGNSLRATARITDVAFNTVAKLFVDAGRACAAYQNDALRNLTCQRIQCDEIWSFIYAKNDNVRRAKAAPIDAGDVRTWIAICADTKLVATWYVGDRTAATARLFLDDLRSRLAGRVQLTSDGLRAYSVMGSVFSDEIDYAVLNKIYGADPIAEKRYSPAKCIGAERQIKIGDPDPKHISTSYVERSNLTMRMSIRRFTRLTNAFSKKLENHALSVALHYMHYNFARIHKTLRVTPAMAAGVSDKLWSIADIANIVEAAAPKPGRPKTYKKQVPQISN
jgi:IS1 family transposase